MDLKKTIMENKNIHTVAGWDASDERTEQGKGLIPKYLHDQGRLGDIYEAMQKYDVDGKEIPKEWIEEMQWLQEQSLVNKKKEIEETLYIEERENNFVYRFKEDESVSAQEIISKKRLAEILIAESKNELYIAPIPYFGTPEMESFLLTNALRGLNEKQRISLYNSLGERFVDKDIHTNNNNNNNENNLTEQNNILIKINAELKEETDKKILEAEEAVFNDMYINPIELYKISSKWANFSDYKTEKLFVGGRS